jgi:Class II Aldolase and Adducin N-terminal domain
MSATPGCEGHYFEPETGTMQTLVHASSGRLVISATSPSIASSVASLASIRAFVISLVSAIHAARGDAQCVLHVHSVNGVAVSTSVAGPVSKYLSPRPTRRDSRVPKRTRTRSPAGSAGTGPAAVQCGWSSASPT